MIFIDNGLVEKGKIKAEIRKQKVENRKEGVSVNFIN